MVFSKASDSVSGEWKWGEFIMLPRVQTMHIGELCYIAVEFGIVNDM